MIDLWKQRLKKYQKQMLKYSKYVFNDNFVLALFFMLGGIAYTYSNFLKTLSLQKDYWWAKPVVVVILVLLVRFIKVATLVSEPDFVFLLPKEKQMKAYLKYAFRRSQQIALVIQCTAMIVLTPFLIYGVHLSKLMVVIVGGTQLIFKLADFKLFQIQYFQPLDKKYFEGIRILYPLLAYLIAFYFTPVLGLILSALGYLLFTYYVRKIRVLPLNWNYLIDQENKRQKRIYTFFNLFTDVPQIKSGAKRRKYLDKFLFKAKYPTSHIYRFLISRAAVRNSEYSGILIRLTLIAMLVIATVRIYWLAVGMAVLFSYLIIFQLLPLFNHFEDNVFTHIYPVKKEFKIQDFQAISMIILLICDVLFVIAGLIGKMSLQEIMIMMVILGIENFLLSKEYLKIKLKTT